MIRWTTKNRMSKIDGSVIKIDLLTEPKNEVIEVFFWANKASKLSGTFDKCYRIKRVWRGVY